MSLSFIYAEFIKQGHGITCTPVGPHRESIRKYFTAFKFVKLPLENFRLAIALTIK